jgi:transcriptional regulator with XRE-family HTH domain
MKERIQKFIDYKGIKAGDLASVMGVQRSNISHILNGRNKPGASFIEKFLLVFPDINARWFLTGKGEMLNIKSYQEPNKTDIPQHPPQLKSEPEIIYGKTNSSEVSKKKIEKVILLYSDETFSVYSQ